MCIVFGCPTVIKPAEDPSPRICPKCHNVAVIDAKERMWFELFWVKLFPVSSSRVWFCSVCQWQVPHQTDWEPTRPNAGFHHGAPGMAPPPPGAPKPYR